MFQPKFVHLNWVLLFFLPLLIFSCKRGPETQDAFSLEIQPEMVESIEDIRWAEHEVIIREIIPTSNNLFLKVEEGRDSYWLVTGLGTLKPGNRYYFNEAVVKRNFVNKELNREFDSIYMVSQLLPESRKNELKRIRFKSHGNNPHAETKKTDEIALSDAQAIKVSLDELLEFPERYKDKSVIVRGICTKINLGIMERNWIHLKTDPSGTKGIVATSQNTVRVGDSITVQAIVRLDKDFGAGYVYPILLEEAILID
jgi:hypothetical protein